MLQSVEAEYENGKIRLFEKPKVKKAHAIVTFLLSEEGKTSEAKRKRRKIDLDKILGVPSSVDKWVGFCKDLGDVDWKDAKFQRIMEKYNKCKRGWLIDSSTPCRLWFRDVKSFNSWWASCHSLLHKTIKKFAPMRGEPSVKTKGELIQVSL